MPRSSKRSTSTANLMDGKKYAEMKLKEIEELKKAAFKLADIKEPYRWPPNVTEMPKISPSAIGVPKMKRAVNTLTDEELVGKR